MTENVIHLKDYLAKKKRTLQSTPIKDVTDEVVRKWEVTKVSMERINKLIKDLKGAK